MPAPVSDDDARTRFFVIGATRLVGAAIVLAGLLGLGGKIGIPAIAAYGFIAFGLFDVFVVPQVLARKWRTPPE
ncbi:MAG TPA: hypothetical protein VIC34_01390 [Croceibacterium sp.]|jgi:hypothetical protein